MRKLIITEFISLDGVIEAPGGKETDHPHAGWQVQYGAPETGKYKVDELASIDTILLGRKTYDVFAAYWPTSGGNPFADRMNALPKYVASKTLKSADWNNTKIIRDVAKEIAELKNTDGGNILVYGSATLVKALLEHDLIDELRLMICPISIGGGLRLFDENRGLNKFTLKHSQIFPSGVVVLEYEPLKK